MQDKKNNLRDIVNGKLMLNFINKNVSIIGKVTSVDPSGEFFHILSTDGLPVKISPLQRIKAHVSGWVEVHGLCTSQKQIHASDFVIFSNEDFSMEHYNDLCSLLYSVKDIWKTSQAS